MDIQSLTSNVEQLFDDLHNIVFYVKDIEGRYRLVNSALVRRSGHDSKDQTLGKTPTELIGSESGAVYEAQDQELFETGKPVRNRLEMRTYADGAMGWCLSHKYPLHSKDGKVIGLMGITVDLNMPDHTGRDYQDLSESIQYVRSNLGNRPTVQHMAEIANLSIYQLDKKMRKIFNLTAGQWIIQQRIDLACALLSGTDRTLSDIAMDIGYSDQSAFTRQFKNTTGMTPRQFQKRKN